MAHALLDKSGQVWIGYFDEGMWDPLSQVGLARFDVGSGERTWAFPTDPDFFDCYALNVEGREAWAYYYSSFELAHVSRDGKLRRWETSVSGANAIVLSDVGVIMLGTYDEPMSAAAWQLGSRQLESPIQVDVWFPEERARSYHTFVCRGRRGYALFADACYAAELEG